MGIVVLVAMFANGLCADGETYFPASEWTVSGQTGIAVQWVTANYSELFASWGQSPVASDGTVTDNVSFYTLDLKMQAIDLLTGNGQLLSVLTASDIFDLPYIQTRLSLPPFSVVPLIWDETTTFYNMPPVSFDSSPVSMSVQSVPAPDPLSLLGLGCLFLLWRKRGET